MRSNLDLSSAETFFHPSPTSLATSPKDRPGRREEAQQLGERCATFQGITPIVPGLPLCRGYYPKGRRLPFPSAAWALAPSDAVKITGETREYASSEHGRRHFCPTCGAGLFYTNAQIFPDQIDVQTATLDDPGALPLQAQIQTAERIGWMADLDALPSFERYPAP